MCAPKQVRTQTGINNKIMEKKMNKLERYCFDLAVEIIGSDLNDVNRVASILYDEFTKDRVIRQRLKNTLTLEGINNYRNK